MIARLNLRDFARHGAIVFAGLMVANVFHYLYYALVGRVVGVAGYGVVTALLSTIMLLALPSNIAAAIIAKLAADLHAVEDGPRLRRLAHLVDASAFTAGAAVFIVLAVCARPIAQFFRIGSVSPVLCAACALAFLIVATAQRAILQGRHLFGMFALSSIIEAVGKSVLGPLGAIAYGPTGALAGLSVALLIAVVFNVFAVRLGTPAATLRLGLPLRSFGVAAAGIGGTLLAINLMLFYDTILVRHFFDGRTAGLYGAAVLVGRAVYTVVGFIPIVLLPKAAQRAARGERPISLLLAAGVIVLLVGGVAISAAAVFPALLVRVIAGPAFVSAGPFVLPYVCALVALAGANAVANYKIGLGRFEHAVPLVVVAVTEVVAVVLRHGSVSDVLAIVDVGAVCALLVTLYRVTAPAPRPAGSYDLASS